jgi:uncharacterized protein YutE (UPF0331/DUF86 family)
LNNTRPDDIILNKCSIVERCIRRIKEEHQACPNLDNYTHVDALILNIERACQATIDMAMHLVAEKHLGIPQSSGHAFKLLADQDLISTALALSLQKMVGFRNIAVHNYQDLDQAILSFVVKKGFNDFIVFCKTLGVKISVE